MSKKLAVVIATTLCCSIATGPASAGTLPPGFVDEPVGTMSVPTAMAPLPDGRIIVTQKNGLVKMISADGVLSSTVILSFGSRICTESERGLGGVAVDPSFSVNKFVYFYWTRKRAGGCGQPSFEGPANRVSRYVMRNDGFFDPNSEYVVLDNIPNQRAIHNGGDLEFAKDGYLWVTVGDGGCHYNNTNLCGSGNPAARETNTLLGKILRVTRDGNPAPGNPWGGGRSCRWGNTLPGDMCAETWSMGLRNPFRFAFDPNATGVRFFINDVGANHWEEIDEGVRGADYGWNVREGPCAVASYTNCGPTGHRNPIHAYRHDTGCTAITGGAFVPNDLWPAPYAGSYLFGDYVCGGMFRLVPQGTGYTMVPFATDMGPLTHMEFGPAPGGGRVLYYLNFDQGGSVRRIRHVGAVNRPPDASLEVSLAGTSLAVTFDASGSSDPDGDPITYALDPGDGSPVIQSTSPTIEHTYATRGRRTATLVVTDDKGLASAPATLEVTVGDPPPEIEVLSPSPDYRFHVGDTIRLQVRATDAEEGVLAPESVSMYVERVHDTHRHPWRDPETGDDQITIAPEPEDFSATRNSHVVATVTATDSGGQQTTREIHIFPRVVFFTVKSNVPISFVANGTSVPQGSGLYPWAGWTMEVSVPVRYDLLRRFLRWEDGAKSTDPTRTIIVPGIDSHRFATYGCC